jgi:hypothetical protein
MVSVAIEDLLEVERRALKKELKEEMVEERRRKLMCFQKKNTHGGDQENCPGHHDYGNHYLYGNS